MRLAGKLDPLIASLYGEIFARSDVEALGPVADVDGLLANADVFVLPSLEEGSPKATPEAIACGLPALVSPIAADQTVRHDVEGWVLDPHDVDAWVEATYFLRRRQ